MIRWSGFGLSVLGIAFVVAKFIEYANEIDLSIFATSAVPISGLAAIYGIAGLFLAYAWKDLLAHFGTVVDTRWAVRTFGVSQLAKYVPGNVFHFIGRQALGAEAGLPAWTIAKSALWELSMLSVTGSVFMILVFPNIFDQLGFSFALIVFALAVLGSAWIVYSTFGRFITRAAGFYIVFLTISGIIFALVLSLVVPAGSISVETNVGIAGAYVVAWLAGMLTPSAPAGAGSRELVLFFLLRSVINEADLITAIILSRIVTASGDVIFYLLVMLIPTSTAETG